MYKAIIDEAHKAKLRVFSHIFALEDGKGLLRKPGLDGFAHLPRDKDIDDEFMSLIRQRPNVFVLPNLPDRAADEDVAWLSETIAPEPLWRMATAGARRTPEQTKTAQDFHGIQARNLAKLNAAGVKIGFGTDGSSGYTVHTEMADMVTAGLTPAQVLVAATRTAAEIIGLPDLGTVASGKSADFVVLDANPLDDIRNTRRISSVFMRGTPVDRAALRRKWTGEGFDEIVIYSPASVQNALRVLGPDYTKERTTRVSFIFSSGGATLNSVRTGAPADIVMLATDLLEPLMKEGLLQPGSMTVLGTVRTGIAIKAGAPAPDISTVEKFKATLLAASSISYQNPTTGSTSGAQVAKIIDAARPHGAAGHQDEVCRRRWCGARRSGDAPAAGQRAAAGARYHDRRRAPGGTRRDLGHRRGRSGQGRVSREGAGVSALRDAAGSGGDLHRKRGRAPEQREQIRDALVSPERTGRIVDGVARRRWRRLPRCRSPARRPERPAPRRCTKARG